MLHASHHSSASAAHSDVPTIATILGSDQMESLSSDRCAGWIESLKLFEPLGGNGSVDKVRGLGLVNAGRFFGPKSRASLVDLERA